MADERAPNCCDCRQKQARSLHRKTRVTGMIRHHANCSLRLFLTIGIVILIGLPLTVRADIRTTIDRGQSVVVKLFGAGVGTLDSYGSGVLVSADGHVVTVWNHLVNTGFLTAVTADGRRFSVDVLGTNADLDLAVMKLKCGEDDQFAFVDYQTEARAETGESVLAFSNMFHVATGSEPVSVVHGVIACETVLDAGLGRWEFPVKSPVYLIDAITNNSGAAGGLLTNSEGIPVGLLGREIRHRETDMWVNYAVPWTSLRPAISAALSGRRPPSMTDSDSERTAISDRDLTGRFGLTLLPEVVPNTPAFVDRIIEGSSADTAGLKRGDLILMVNERVVRSARDFRIELNGFRRNQQISITVNRNEVLQTFSLRVP